MIDALDVLFVFSAIWLMSKAPLEVNLVALSVSIAIHYALYMSSQTISITWEDCED